MSVKNTDEILRALLDTELRPEKDVPMKRFGVNFRIQAIDGKTINKIREQASFPAKGGVKKLDDELFGTLVIEKACLSPDWSDRALLDAFGPTSTDAIQNRLLAGEIAKLSAEILELSGFGDDDDAVEDVKN